MSAAASYGRRRLRSKGQAIVEYLVCTVLVALVLIVPVGAEGSGAACLVRAFERLLESFAWLVAVA